MVPNAELHDVERERDRIRADYDRLREAVQRFLRIEYPGGTGHPADEEASRLREAARLAYPGPKPAEVEGRS